MKAFKNNFSKINVLPFMMSLEKQKGLRKPANIVRVKSYD